eukprot:5291149-Heterocapsa_arctica.AAC.1
MVKPSRNYNNSSGSSHSSGSSTSSSSSSGGSSIYAPSMSPSLAWLSITVVYATVSGARPPSGSSS